MANESTTTSLNDLLPSIVAEALFQAQERSIMRGLVRNYVLPAGSGKTITVPKYPVVAAADLTEGTDMSNTEVATGGAVLTVGEVGVMATVTDLAMRTSSSNVISDIGAQLGRGIATKMDTDLVGLFDGFSTAVGDGTGNFSVAALYEAIAYLEEQGLPSNELVCVLHPRIIFDLKADLTNSWAGGSDVQGSIMTAGFAGFAAGVPVYRSANITSTSGVSKGAVFHREALGLAMLQDISIEPQRDASLRATELNATSVYGVGELFDEYGVELHYVSTLG